MRVKGVLVILASSTLVRAGLVDTEPRRSGREMDGNFKGHVTETISALSTSDSDFCKREVENGTSPQ